MSREQVDLWLHETKLREEGFRCIAGVDEAGRGPLAGPVFAAAVILPFGLEIPGLNDSKKLSEKKREALFDVIRQQAIAYSICSADEKEIDRINILQATMQTMVACLRELQVTPDVALIDGNRCPESHIPCQWLVGGDAASANIAAASILAKVSRDRFMLEQAQLYPQYHFEKHKGYGTKLHREILREIGPSPIHRRSFLGKILAGTPFEKQL
ncbi:MAG: ribonuclease HII [Eubacteriales bacterium]